MAALFAEEAGEAADARTAVRRRGAARAAADVELEEKREVEGEEAAATRKANLREVVRAREADAAEEPSTDDTRRNAERMSREDADIWREAESGGRECAGVNSKESTREKQGKNSGGPVPTHGAAHNAPNSSFLSIAETSTVEQ